MKLDGVLQPERVAFESGKLASKRESIQALCRLLSSTGTGGGYDAVFQAIQAREALQSTGMGAGVAVPHAVLPESSEPVGALLLLRQPIDFAAVDNKPVHILFGLVGPPAQSVRHLRVLARVSKVLRDAVFRRSLLEAKTASQAYALFCERDGMLR